MLIGEKERLTRLGLACGGLQPPVTYSACIPSTCPKLLKRSIVVLISLGMSTQLGLAPILNIVFLFLCLHSNS